MSAAIEWELDSQTRWSNWANVIDGSVLVGTVHDSTQHLATMDGATGLRRWDDSWIDADDELDAAASVVLGSRLLAVPMYITKVGGTPCDHDQTAIGLLELEADRWSASSDPWTRCTGTVHVARSNAAGGLTIAIDSGWWESPMPAIEAFAGAVGQKNTPYATDLDTDGGLDLLTSEGIRYSSGAEILWPFSVSLTQIGIAANPEPVVVLATGYALVLTDAAGTVLWSLPFDGADGTSMIANLPSIGDATGDGTPEICAAFMTDTGYEARLIGLDGGVVSVWDSAVGTASCSMADLDADGAYEVIWYDTLGLRIVNGRDGTVYWSDPSIQPNEVLTAVQVADVDLDGSAELVVTGAEREGGASVLRVYGAASGRWARTRPVWNQRAYDVVSVNDDGTVPAFPFNAWETYNAWRAQPAHDGDHPDLSVVATDICAEDCTDGSVHLAVQVANAGSHDAQAGAVVRLWTRTGDAWREVASVVVPDAIPAHTAAAGVALTVSLADWGEEQVLQVDGADPDECDRANDRANVSLTVCED